ncbi:MAG: inositol monophosphatase [Bacteroidales bacterium]|nr:inositol monophosphatase [Bacteroidales bacterium]
MKQTLVDCLKASGRLLLKNLGLELQLSIKESQSSIVTSADYRSDDLIVDTIRKRYPSHNIISEESGFIDCGSVFTWVIDPLDGTSNFASALPWFGVLITLFENNTPVMGGAYLPVSDTLYFAERGKGVTRNGEKIIMKRQNDLKNSLFAFSVDFTDDDELFGKCIDIYKNVVKNSRSIRSTNSLVDFLSVAEGKFGGCINLFTKIWDISGLGLIITEAGGLIMNIDGNDIQFRLDSSGNEQNYAVMAGSPIIIDEINKYILNGSLSVRR